MNRLVLYFLICGIVFGDVAAEPTDARVAPADARPPVVEKSAPVRLQAPDYRPIYGGLDFTQSSNDANFSVGLVAGGEYLVDNLGYDHPGCAGNYAANPGIEIFVDQSVTRVDIRFTHNSVSFSGDSQAGLLVLGGDGEFIGCEQQPNVEQDVAIAFNIHGNDTLAVWVTSFYNETFEGVLNISSTLAA